MKRYWNAFCMGFGTFTALPCPYRPWDEDARDLMLLCLPIVGAIIGLLWAALGQLGLALLPATGGALIAALPWLLTGFIHLDGYLDACDAILSWRPLEQRLRILKDAHAGAFAVVGFGILMLFSYDAGRAVAASGNLRALVLIPIVSRCGSAVCLLTLKPLGTSSYAKMWGDGAQGMAVAVMLAITLAVGWLWLGRPAFALLVEALAYALAMLWAYRALRGVSGDVAGFALCVSECAALVALANLQ